MNFRTVLLAAFTTGLIVFGAVVYLYPSRQPDSAAAAVQAAPMNPQLISADAPQATTATAYINWIALPVQDGRLSKADDLGLMVNATQVQYWDATGQGYVTRRVGISGFNFDLLPGNAYRVRIESTSGTTNLSLYGEVTYPTFALQRGVAPNCKLNWIMVPPSKSHLDTADKLGQDIGGVLKVMYWDATNSGYVTRRVGVSGFNFEVKYGYPYVVCLINSSGGSSWP